MPDPDRFLPLVEPQDEGLLRALEETVKRASRVRAYDLEIIKRSHEIIRRSRELLDGDKPSRASRKVDASNEPPGE